MINTEGRVTHFAYATQGNKETISSMAVIDRTQVEEYIQLLQGQTDTVVLGHFVLEATKVNRLRVAEYLEHILELSNYVEFTDE